jgi:hypothetical protein
MGGRGGGSRMDSMATALQLDKDQKREAKATFDAAAKEATPVRDEITKARVQLATAIAEKKGQAELDPLIQAYSAELAKMADIELRAFTKIFKGLSTEQRNMGARRVYENMITNMFMKKNWDQM